MPRPNDAGRDPHTGLPVPGVDSSVTHIYVDQDNGSDENTGGETDPLQTLDAALAIVRGLRHPTHPSGIYHVHEDTYIHLAQAAGRYTLDMSKGWVCTSGSLRIGSPDVSVLDSGTLTSNVSGITLTDAGAAWTADEHVGKWVRTVTAGGTSQYRQILENDATTLTVAAEYQVQGPSSGEAYEIFEPVTEVDVVGQTFIGLDIACHGAIGLSESANESFSGYHYALENLLLFSSTGPYFEGVDFNICELTASSNRANFSRCRMGVGTSDVFGTGNTASLIEQFQGAGLRTNHSLSDRVVGNSYIGSYVGGSLLISRTRTATEPSVYLLSARILGTGGGAAGIQCYAASLEVGSGLANRSKVIIKHLDGDSTGLPLGLLAEMSRVELDDSYDIDVSAQAGAIAVKSIGSDIALKGAGANGRLNGGAGGYGLLCEGGRVISTTNLANVLVGGSVTGALAVGFLPTTADAGAGGPLASEGGSLVDASTLSLILRASME